MGGEGMCSGCRAQECVLPQHWEVCGMLAGGGGRGKCKRANEG
jgi:hypothetical protein